MLLRKLTFGNMPDVVIVYRVRHTITDVGGYLSVPVSYQLSNFQRIVLSKVLVHPDQASVLTPGRVFRLIALNHSIKYNFSTNYLFNFLT